METALMILDFLRKNRMKKISFDHFLSQSNNVPSYLHFTDTLSCSIWGAIVELCVLNLVIIKNSNNQPISNSLTLENYKSTYIDFYEDNIRGKEKDMFLSTTPHLHLLQETLGFSITKSLEFSIGTDKISVSPFWGNPRECLNDVFVLMPFENKYKDIYHDHIDKTCKQMNLSCLRADLIFGSQVIVKDIWSLIFGSKIIIADCTGKNPNVFYELGIAHAIGKKVIIITQDTDDIPFDIKHIRYIKYDFTPKGMCKFENELKAFIMVEYQNIEDSRPLVDAD